MSRAEFSRRRPPPLALCAALLLAACGSAPVSEPPLRQRALAAESEGARRYARGDHAGAARSFGAAGRLQQSLDDPAAAARNSLHQARAELAQGQAAAALERARRIDAAQFALDALLLQAQAELSLARPTAARETLAAAATACAAVCPQRASLNLLQARAALAEGRAPEALGHAEAALKLLQDQDEAAETGNAWRLIAAARLAAGDASGALPAAAAALEIDRRLALPEKIARDWLLIGEIRQRVGAGDTAPAYRRALEVANAAGLAELAGLATQALKEIDKPKETAR